jgi:hypothetical protein
LGLYGSPRNFCGGVDHCSETASDADGFSANRVPQTATLRRCPLPNDHSGGQRISVVLSPKHCPWQSPDGSPLAVESVNFFVSFDRDVLIKTLEISSPDFKLPRHETKEYNQRFAIVTFDGPLPMGTLELKAGF